MKIKRTLWWAELVHWGPQRLYVRDLGARMASEQKQDQQQQLAIFHLLPDWARCKGRLENAVKRKMRLTSLGSLHEREFRILGVFRERTD